HRGGGSARATGAATGRPPRGGPGAARSSPRRSNPERSPPGRARGGGGPSSLVPLRDRDGRGDPRVVRERQVEAVDPQLGGPRSDRPRDLDDGRSASHAVHGRVVPEEVTGGAERLGDRFLRGEPRREGRRRYVTLSGREELLAQSRGTLELRHEACDVHDVDPDPDNHATTLGRATRR